MEVNWNEQPLVRWLGTVTRKNTLWAYKSAFRKYTEFTGMTATVLIDEAIEDLKRDIRDRRDTVKTRLLKFYRWLVDEYPVYSQGKGERKLIRKGLRSKSAHMYINAIRSFYATYEITVKLKGKSALPKPRVYNKRLQLTSVDIKALVDHARSPRDRAIILTMFQGGMDVSTLCGMKYEDIAEGLKVDLPMKVELFRGKTGIDYYSFLGRDAVESIKAYLNDARSRGIQFKSNTSLFVKEIGKGKPMKTNLVQKVLRETSVRAGLVDKENNGKDMNPCSPHALRESFGSIMTNNGVPDTVVDFWLGHEIGEMAKAYKGARFNELKKMYSERERFISISVPESDVVEDLRKQMEERSKDVEASNRDLLRMVREYREDIDKMKEAMKWMLSEIRMFQKETLKRMGESPEQIEQGMKLAGSKLEDYLK